MQLLASAAGRGTPRTPRHRQDASTMSTMSTRSARLNWGATTSACGQEQALAALLDTRHSDHLVAQTHTKISEHFVRPTALTSHRNPSDFAQWPCSDFLEAHRWSLEVFLGSVSRKPGDLRNLVEETLGAQFEQLDLANRVHGDHLIFCGNFQQVSGTPRSIFSRPQHPPLKLMRQPLARLDNDCYPTCRHFCR